MRYKIGDIIIEKGDGLNPTFPNPHKVMIVGFDSDSYYYVETPPFNNKWKYADGIFLNENYWKYGVDFAEMYYRYKSTIVIEQRKEKLNKLFG